MAFKRKKRGSHRRQGGRAKQLVVKSNSRDVELLFVTALLFVVGKS